MMKQTACLLFLFAMVALSSSACIFITQVQPGDTCYSIATNKCRTSLSSLYAANPSLNNGNSCNFLQIGQNICCPLPTPGQCSNAYFVQAGDTCFSIANFYGITLSQLYSYNPSLNNGAGCSTLQAGQIICGSAPGK